MRAMGVRLALLVGVVGACSGAQLGGPRQDAGTTPPVTGRPAFDASTTPFFPDASTTPVYSDACWAASLPGQVQPILPSSLTVNACAAGTGAPQWSYPQNPAGSNADDRRYIVGRWQTCNASLPGLPPHSVIEFGANGRWRLLTFDASVNPQPVGDGLLPLTGTGTSGSYYLLGTGQLDLNYEVLGTGGSVVFVAFAGMDTLQFSNTGANPVYARITPSPLNGADNPPPTAAGCSMVGDWDVPAGSNGAPAAVFSFDAAGNFVAGPPGANLCDGHTMYGTYALSPGMFQLTTNVGFGLCAWWFGAGYPAVFDTSCNQLSLTPEIDNCTGGRGYFNQPTTMTRRIPPSGDAGTSTLLGAAVRGP